MQRRELPRAAAQGPDVICSSDTLPCMCVIITPWDFTRPRGVVPSTSASLFRCVARSLFFSFFVHFLLSLHCATPLAARTSDSHHNKPKKFSSSRHEAQCRTCTRTAAAPVDADKHSHNTTRSNSLAQSCSALPAHIVAIDNGRFACCCRSVRRARAARSHRLGYDS